LLPEDLRSSIVKNYGRRLIKEYTDDLLAAVAFWRQIGAWRSKLSKTATSAITPGGPAVVLSASKERNVIALAKRRRTPAVQTGRHFEVGSEYTLDRPKTAAG
jgi:hypothetical protein